jgi:hypothetical protein
MTTCRGLLLFLLEPILHSGSSTRIGSRALNIRLLGLVVFELVCNVCFFRTGWCTWDGELLDDSLCVGSFHGGGLEGGKLLEVQLLDEISCERSQFVDLEVENHQEIHT